MSLLADDLRDAAMHPICDLAADEIEDLERAYELLFTEVGDLRKDAERYRYLRNRKPQDVLGTAGDAAGCWVDCEVGELLTLLTGEDADKAIDAAMALLERDGAA
jgi:hypothetical protein